MSSAMTLLLEAHRADVGARNGRWMRPARTHALGALERTVVEMNHGDVAVETVAERKRLVTGVTAMFALVEMRHSVVLVGIASLCKALRTERTGERFVHVRRATVRLLTRVERIGGGGWWGRCG